MSLALVPKRGKQEEGEAQVVGRQGPFPGRAFVENTRSEHAYDATMPKDRVYLDHAASTPMDPEAHEFAVVARRSADEPT